MPANTTRGYPYPLPTEPVAEGAQAIRNLADGLNAKVASDLIATVGPIASPAVITFSAIPQLYTSLHMIYYLMSTAPAPAAIRLNNDPGLTYQWTNLSAGGTSVTAASYIVDYLRVGRCHNYSPTEGRIFLPNYAKTNNWKHVLGESHNIDGGAAAASFLDHNGGLWQNVAAINRIDFYPYVSPFTCGAGSYAYLYGVK